MRAIFRILAVNPGSTSTKIALYEDEKCIFKDNLSHPHSEISKFDSLLGQAAYRSDAIATALEAKGVKLGSLSALVVRGGILKPLKGGVYTVDDEMYDDLHSFRYGRHASNLGGIIALPLAKELGIPAFTVDPVTVDEFEDAARFSGFKDVSRLSMAHTLNMKAVARKAAAESGTSYDELNLVIVHLGSGISVSAHRRGRMIDVNNANNEGPFSLERTGTLPALALIRLCFSGSYNEKEMMDLICVNGGIYSYLGTKDFREVEKSVADGDTFARRVVEAMAYQVSKETAAMTAVLSGEVDMIIITGGMAHSKLLTDMIKDRVSFLAPVVLVPGEEELEALALGALRVLRGEEKAQSYAD